MKRIFYIGLLFLGLVVSSCSKEEIVTNSNQLDGIAPEWSSNARPEAVSSDDGSEPIVRGGGIIGSGPIINFPPNDGLTGDITDPNNDPDGTKKDK